MVKLFHLLFILLGFGVSFGQFSYNGCPDVSSSDFRFVDVVSNSNDPTLREVLKMDFHLNAQGQTEIYFVERSGGVKRFRNGNITLLGTIQVLFEQNGHAGNVEEGLVGIAVDPKFADNGFLYLMYSPLNVNVFRVSRITVQGNSLQMNSEKILIDMPTQRDQCCHTGGGMVFDEFGDLWISVGNNTQNDVFIHETVKYKSDEWGASSTAGLRGGIIRIHPDENLPKGYSIPSGNFGDYFADFFEQQGNTALANEYRDTSKVKPEIYIKGTRNAFSLAVDPVRRWVMFGDVGPDFGGDTEESNLYTHPVFAGWPYWAGDNVVNQHIPQNLRKTDASKPMNTSTWNEGVTQLPPAAPGTYNYRQSCAIAGPIYRYDGSLQSNIKFPPHFDRKWFFSDWNNSGMKVATVENDGSGIVGNPVQFLNNGNTNITKPLDLKFGPDGALYAAEYIGWFAANAGQKIVRAEYTGNCRPATPVPEYTGCKENKYVQFDANATAHDSAKCIDLVDVKDRLAQSLLNDVQIKVTNSIVEFFVPNEETFDWEIIGANGLIAASGSRSIKAKVQLEKAKFESGIYFLKIKTDFGFASKRIVVY